MQNEIQGENGIVSKGIICKVFQCIKRASDISQFSLVPRGPLGPLMFSSCKARSNKQKQRLSGNGDREAGTIVVGAGLCDGEGELSYTF